MKDAIWFGRPAWEVIAWIIFIIIILWALRQEQRTGHCYDGQIDCGPVWSWDPKPDDKIPDLIKRLENANRAETFVITRRIVMISAAGLTFVLMWYFNKKKVVPNFIEYLVPFVLVMGCLWFSFRYHESHYLDEINRRMDLTLQELKYQTHVSVRPANVGI